jgi:2,4-dienoyl-CoA reductase-like NADH-dependent reductase (Old Yellow Enzyme family)
MSRQLFAPLSFAHGKDMPNRFMLAPMTNLADDQFTEP